MSTAANTRRRWAAVGLTAAAYLVTARLGLALVVRPEGVAVAWPPAGLLLAALLAVARRDRLPVLCAGVVAHVLASLAAGNAAAVAASFAAARGVESLAAAWAVERFVGRPPRFDTHREVLRFALAAPLASSAVTALLGAAAAVALSGAPFWAAWRVWWVADGVGMLVVAPLVLAWTSPRPAALGPRGAAELAFLLAGLAVTAQWQFTLEPASAELLSGAPYLVFPFLLWAAVRFGPREGAAACLVLATVAVWQSHNHQGPFEVPGLSGTDHVLAAQIFLAVSTLATLLLAAVTAEWRWTERALREALRRELDQTAVLGGILAAAPVGIVVTDDRMGVLRLNAVAAGMGRAPGQPPAGRRPGSVLGCLFAEASSGDCGTGPLCPECGLRDLVAEVLATGEPVLQREVPFRHVGTAGGPPLWLLASAVRTTVGAKRAVVVTVQDISERRAREEELRAAKQEAEAAGLAKVQFLSSVSHEMRTPLNGVIGMLDLAADGERGAAAAEYLAMARQSAESLRRVIDEILDFSRLEAGDLTLERLPFDPRSVVDAAAGTWVRAAREKGLALRRRVESDVPARVVGDPWRLQQVLAILIGNAVKFTDAGEVEVTVGLLAESRAGRASPSPRECRSPGLSFTVRDTGIGIAADAVGRLFQGFSQVDGSSTRRHGGPGLGLAVARQLVERMGGAIGVTSAPGRGSAFTFELPAATEGAGADTGPDAGEERASDLSELLANLGNDRSLLAEIIGVFLGDVPGRVETLKSAVDARDAPALERAAHGLKGAVSTFGAKRAQRLAGELEGMGRSLHMAAAPAAAQVLEAELARLARELAAAQAFE